MEVNPEENIPAGASVFVIIDGDVLLRNDITTEAIMTAIIQEILANEGSDDDNDYAYAQDVEEATSQGSDTVLIV